MEAILETVQTTKASLFSKPADSVWPFRKYWRSHLGRMRSAVRPPRWRVNPNSQLKSGKLGSSIETE